MQISRQGITTTPSEGREKVSDSLELGRASTRKQLTSRDRGYSLHDRKLDFPPSLLLILLDLRDGILDELDDLCMSGGEMERDLEESDSWVDIRDVSSGVEDRSILGGD